jgi:hypothetical protein
MLEAKTIRKKPKIQVKKPVKCVETGKIYASSTDAADLLSTEGLIICPRAILNNCRGKQKTAGGFRWEYA